MSEKKPKDGQKVFYFFDVVGVHAGTYQKTEVPEGFAGSGVFMDCFYGDKGGWLCDDVTHWMPRNDCDKVPRSPRI